MLGGVQQLGQEELKLEQRQAAHSTIKNVLGPAAVALAAAGAGGTQAAEGSAQQPAEGLAQPGPPSSQVSPTALLLERSAAAAEKRLQQTHSIAPGAGPSTGAVGAGEGAAAAHQNGVGPAGPAPGSAGSDVEAAVEHAREALAGALFRAPGGSITDLSVFLRHSERSVLPLPAPLT